MQNWRALQRGSARLALGMAVCMVAATGCSDSGSKDGGDITLTVATFSDFGYKKTLYKEYEKAHPNIKIKERISQFDPHHKQLATHLGTGSGAADIEAVEEGFMPQFRQSKDKFANLADFGAKDLKSQWLDWKWQQASPDDSLVLGLGTDVGSLAMCYRPDLFKKAGLPTDREAVSALWPTWDQYFATGKRFKDSGAKAKFFDGANNINTALLNQAPFGYFDPDGDKFVGDTNPVVKESFIAAANASKDGLSAKLEPFSQPWTVGFKQGTFATLTCPAWMIGLIKDAVGPGGANTWDVARVPGEGGNWGGSFLTVPKQGKHQKEAYELAKFLTSPTAEKKIFEETGNLPSQPELLKDPAVLALKQPFFNNAPTGEIFAKSAESLKPNYRGVRDGEARPAFTRALLRVEQGKQEPAAAFDEAVKESKKVLGL
jgi:cellobiose transport system substrate-binding protein